MLDLQTGQFVQTREKELHEQHWKPGDVLAAGTLGSCGGRRVGVQRGCRTEEHEEDQVVAEAKV